MGTASTKLEKKDSEVKGRLEFIGKRANESIMAVDDHIKKRKEKYGVSSDNSISVDANVPNAALGSRGSFPERDSEATKVWIPKFSNVPNATMGEQIAAGWPRWLVEAASEAIKGWIPRPPDSFNKIDKIGSGTYSNVYKAYDRQNDKMVALKKVRVDTSDIQSVKFMAREILILRKLDHQNIIKLEGLGTTRIGCSLYLVFECMEHDLSRIISRPGVQFTESEVKCYMHQLLSGIEYCHSQGVLHRDIKSSNILIDDLGRLKIIDFGLSTSYESNIELTSRVGTLWYRSPELLLGATFYGPAVDLWSAGCVLGELYTKRPVMPGRNEIEQLYKIFKLCGAPSDDYFSKPLFDHQISFRPPTPFRRCITEAFNSIPTAALGLIETLLSIDPDHRGTATSALSSEFFTAEPIPCDPSSLPRHQPSNRSNCEIVEEESSRITDKRHDYEMRRRRVRQTGLAVTKLDRHGFKGKKIDSSIDLIGVSSNVAQAVELHDQLWETMVGEFEEHESLLEKDSGYVGVFGFPPSHRVHMLQDKNMHESGTKNWLQKWGRISFQNQERQTKLNPLHSNSSFDSAKKIDELLDEHDRQIQEAVERSMIEKKMVKSAGLKFVSNS